MVSQLVFDCFSQNFINVHPYTMYCTCVKKAIRVLTSYHRFAYCALVTRLSGWILHCIRTLVYLVYAGEGSGC